MTPEQKKSLEDLEDTIRGYFEEHGPLKTMLTLAEVHREVYGGDWCISASPDGNYTLRRVA
jgi:hypothetical protein